MIIMSRKADVAGVAVGETKRYFITTGEIICINQHLILVIPTKNNMPSITMAHSLVPPFIFRSCPFHIFL
jgi:hypothetical protein